MDLLPHPTRPEALSIDAAATLSRWDLSSDDPVRLAHVTLAHHDALLSTDGQRVLLPYAIDPKRHLSSAAVEVRDYESLQRVGEKPLPRGPTMLQSVGASARGWLAIGGYNEKLLVLDRDLDAAAKLPGGEWISGCATDASGKLLAAAHTYQGGGYVSLYAVRRMRGLRSGRVRTRVQVLRAQLDRDAVPGEHREFADTFASCAFGPGGKYLAVYETSGSLAPGAVSLYDVATGALRWWSPVTAEQTGDHRVLPDAGYRLGYPSRIAFTPEGREVVVGSTAGAVVCLRARDGSHSRTLRAGDFDVHLLFVEPSRNRVWALDQRVGRPVAVAL